ncbi:hypothetical protein B0H19DRAFT_1268177 [Mycena capillaripes]|nr:hypothetical protein B0H19DRAFT_1268177 [Mycena capillaripes]
MAPQKLKKPKPSVDDILDRQAQAAWAYRQRNRQAINEKAQIRMRNCWEQLKNAPNAVQLEHSLRAAQYRRNYIERTKKINKPLPKLPVKTTPSSTPVASKSAVAKSNKTVTTSHTAIAAAPRRGQKPQSPAPALWTARSRAPDSPTFADLDRSDDDEGSEDEGWEADTEREDGRRLLNPTGHPDYVLQPGQQPYMRNGHRYWF